MQYYQYYDWFLLMTNNDKIFNLSPGEFLKSYSGQGMN